MATEKPIPAKRIRQADRSFLLLMLAPVVGYLIMFAEIFISFVLFGPDDPARGFSFVCFEVSTVVCVAVGVVLALRNTWNRPLVVVAGYAVFVCAILGVLDVAERPGQYELGSGVFDPLFLIFVVLIPTALYPIVALILGIRWFGFARKAAILGTTSRQVGIHTPWK